MYRLTLAAAVASLALSLPAYATSKPPSNSAPQASANSRATAGAVAGARADARGGNARATGGNARATGGRGGSAAANVSQTTQVSVAGASAAPLSGTTTIRTAPDVAAPAIWSNNPCIISASGSVSVVGFGASIGAGVEDADCTRRANAQLLSAMGQTDAAREVMCENREVRAAFARTGRPCAADVQAVRPASAPVVVPAAVTVREAPAPVNTSGLSDESCRRLRERGMAVAGCP